MLWVPPVLVIEDRKYPLRKLGLLDVERLGRIVTKASKTMDKVAFNAVVAQRAANRGKDSEDSKEDEITGPSPAMWMGFISDFLPQCFDEVVAFLASIIGLGPGVSEDVVEQKRKKSKAKEFHDPNEGTIRDPEIFPLDALPALIAKLTEHRNVVDFFAKRGAMVAGLKKLFGASNKPSTESSKPTDGPTSTSPEDDLPAEETDSAIPGSSK